MRRIWVLFLCSGLLFLLCSQTTAAEEEVKKIGEIQVTAPREDTGVVLAPEATVIDVETYQHIKEVKRYKGWRADAANLPLAAFKR